MAKVLHILRSAVLANGPFDFLVIDDLGSLCCMAEVLQGWYICGSTSIALQPLLDN